MTPTDSAENPPSWNRSFSAIQSQLAIWFGFRSPVNRRQYWGSGIFLMLLKYGVEASAFWEISGAVYTPLNFLTPVLSLRAEQLPGAPSWVVTAWLIWTLPFLWIALSMSVRRAVNAGVPPSVGLLILIPLLNLGVMAILATLPEGRPLRPREHQRHVTAQHQIQTALLGVMFGALFSLVMLLVSVSIAREYGAALFLATPVLIGTISSAISNRPMPQSYAASMSLGMLAVMISGGVILVFALEGLICLLMAAPIALPLGALGGAIGKMIASTGQRPGRETAAMLLLFPGWAGMESMTTSHHQFLVSTAVEIDASAERVWDEVIGFPDLPPPQEWFFRWGIAYPIRGQIFGAEVGATRHCIFSTGTFVEPITIWDAPHRLAFDVAEQPHPMFELSPYRHIHPPHLDGTLRSTRGEFVLIPLAEGRTRLVGNTWYELEMFPQIYWTLWADALIHRIHQRVLEHVKVHAEASQALREIHR